MTELREEKKDRNIGERKHERENKLLLPIILKELKKDGEEYMQEKKEEIREDYKEICPGDENLRI